MNKWTEKSIHIANSDGYLDKLQSVYPVILTEEREIDKEIVDDLKKTFDALDSENLIKKLLSFEKFPIKDSYVAFLRRKKGHS